MKTIINHKSLSYKFSYKLAYIPVLSSHRNQIQHLNFQDVGYLVTRNICFLFIVSRALLQRYTEVNRLLQKDFLTCYSFSYYSSMIYIMQGDFQSIQHDLSAKYLLTIVSGKTNFCINGLNINVNNTQFSVNIPAKYSAE